MTKNLLKGNPYFSDNSDKNTQYSYLDNNIECDIVIVGGGIDGAITAHFLSESGIKVTLIDKGRFGQLSTTSATALLEYQLDEHAKDLKKVMSEKEIVACYKLNLQALKTLDEYIGKYGNDCHYCKRPIMVYGTDTKNNAALEQEYEFRQKHGFNCSLITKKNNVFSFSISRGIYSGFGGAELNPYMFTQQMIKSAISLGAKAYENTAAVKITYSDNYVIVTTNYGYTISAKKVVCATGYDTSLFLKKPLCKKHISYSLVSSVMPNFSWHNQTLLHDNESPYHYMRLLPDNRVIIGGGDIVFRKKIKSKTARKKYKNLEDHFLQMFPTQKGKVCFDYKFCGIFGTTKNNMGVIGPTKKHPNLWYMLGYGANGIVSCLYGAKALAQLWFGSEDKDLYLFSPDRKIY